MPPETLAVESVPVAPAAVSTPEAPETPSTDPADPPAPPEPRVFSQEDVDKIVTKRLGKAQRSWERERQQLLDRVLAPIGREAQQAPQSAVPGSSEAPDPAKFTDFNQYVQAAIAHGVKQALSEREQASSAMTAQQRAAERQAILAQGVQKQAAVGAEKYEDFDDVVGDPSLPITEVMTMVIAESEIGADLAYWLGKNPNEAHRIAALPPVSVARELGKIEAKLQATPTAVTKAPPPITPAKGAAGGEKDPSKMSDAEFAAWRKKQIAARRH